MSTHAYTTTVVSDDGSFAAEIISFPHYFSDVPTFEQLNQLVEDLNLERGAPVTELTLTELLEQVAYETAAARRAPREMILDVIDAVAHQPILVLEESPAFGTTLAGVLSQAPPAYVLIAEGRPFVALALEAGIVLVWFIGGPVQGVREGLRDATRTVTSELAESWLRKRFRRSRRR